MPEMTKVEQDAWLDHHTTVCPRSDWPREPAFWQVWRRRVAALKCDFRTACEASDRVADSPPRFLDGHLDAVSDAVKAIYGERDARRNSTEGLVERAERGDELNPGEVVEVARLCRDCPSCSGNGIAVRTGKHTGKPISVHCRCTYGRWIRARCQKTAPDVFRRTPSLASDPWLDGEEYGGPGVAMQPAYAGHRDDDDDLAF